MFQLHLPVERPSAPEAGLEADYVLQLQYFLTLVEFAQSRGMVLMRDIDVLDYLNTLFDVIRIKDDSHNGVQIQPPVEIGTVAFAVDAAMASFERAAEEDADLLVVHHGLFWRNVERVVDQHYHRLKFMLENEIGLYAMHLPLDAHPEVGNNRQLADIAGADDVEPFALEEGVEIGFIANFDVPVSREDLTAHLDRQLDTSCHVLPFGPEEISRLGIVSGGGADFLSDAIAADCDAFLTGEAEHIMYHVARERGINVLAGGHYATETVGLKAVKRVMDNDLDVRTVFIDHPTGL
jgi:dinuclear metal center YbgI/SA1388 family protein